MEPSRDRPNGSSPSGITFSVEEEVVDVVTNYTSFGFDPREGEIDISDDEVILTFIIVTPEPTGIKNWVYSRLTSTQGPIDTYNPETNDLGLGFPSAGIQPPYELDTSTSTDLVPRSNQGSDTTVVFPCLQQTKKNRDIGTPEGVPVSILYNKQAQDQPRTRSGQIGGFGSEHSPATTRDHGCAQRQPTPTDTLTTPRPPVSRDPILHRTEIEAQTRRDRGSLTEIDGEAHEEGRRRETANIRVRVTIER
ncbi:receptor-like protein kinase FERONIA [Dorcoceras hygrometricum]|uniref:Receptor-like protein kinase FERONIA n=1 Tax=Dorcoceras hygrometricum TaxID=472368 RepID=A0A2Z7A4X8_9LAMI|nr:receptor-like protein kinase FERONIA [Dorcoceras hygrometricum]